VRNQQVVDRKADSVKGRKFAPRSFHEKVEGPQGPNDRRERALVRWAAGSNVTVMDDGQ